MQRPDIDAAVNLADRPKTPLPGFGLALQRRRVERSGCVLLGEIERDGERLEQRKAAVDDEGQPAVRINRQKLRRPRAGIADLDRQVLVGELKLVRHPQRAKSAGAGDAVDAQVRHAACPGYAAEHSG